MAENSSNSAIRRWAVTDFAIGQPVNVTGGILAGATGVISFVPNSRERALKVNGWPEGVYVIVLGEAIAVEPV